MQLEKTNRQWHIDLLRFICILFVLYNHSSAYQLFTINTEGVLFYVYATMSSMCKIAVPTYFMISGALLLGREEGLKELFIKRVLKYILILLVFSIIMYVTNNHCFNMGEFVKQLIVCNIHLPYWFLYRYLVFLLCLPLLRCMVKGMKTMHYVYLLVMYLVFYSITETLDLCFVDFVKYNWAFNIQNWLYVYIEPLLGYFILKRMPDNCFKKKWVIILGMLAFVAVGTNVFLVRYDGIVNGTFRENYITIWHIVIEIFIVYFARYLQLNIAIGSYLKESIIWLGKAAFGVYLLEGLVRKITLEVSTNLKNHITVLGGSLVHILIIYFIGAVISLSFYGLRDKATQLIKNQQDDK